MELKVQSDETVYTSYSSATAIQQLSGIPSDESATQSLDHAETIIEKEENKIMIWNKTNASKGSKKKIIGLSHSQLQQIVEGIMEIRKNVKSEDMSKKEIANKYTVIRALEEGGFGQVFIAVDKNHKQYAVKRQINTKCMLGHEYDIIKHVARDACGNPSVGFPGVFSYTVESGWEYLVMSRLGKSLHSLLVDHDQFSMKTVLMIGIQMVRRLEFLHDRGILHRDIKPANILTGLGCAEERTIFLVDFGLSDIIGDWDEYNRLPEPSKLHRFRGTEMYAPPTALIGNKRATRYSDLQSLGYSMICMATGTLPWNDEDSQTGQILGRSEMGFQRTRMGFAEMCEGCRELEKFMKIVGCDKKGRPDYNRLVRMLEDELHNIGHQNDGKFDWIGDRKKDGSLSFFPEGLGFSFLEDCARAGALSDRFGDEENPPRLQAINAVVKAIKELDSMHVDLESEKEGSKWKRSAPDNIGDLENRESSQKRKLKMKIKRKLRRNPNIVTLEDEDFEVRPKPGQGGTPDIVTIEDSYSDRSAQREGVRRLDIVTLDEDSDQPSSKRKRACIEQIRDSEADRDSIEPLLKALRLEKYTSDGERLNEKKEGVITRSKGGFSIRRTCGRLTKRVGAIVYGC